MVVLQLSDLLFLLIITIVLSIDTSQPAVLQQPWTLPVFPAKKTTEKPLPQPHYFKSISINESIDVATASHSGKLIPRFIWIAVKNASADLNYQIPELFKRNPLWRGFVCGNEEKDRFMEEQFAGTSLLWVYQQIRPWAGAAKADIWRYAVLWLYGGVYVDDDSDIRTPLDKVVEPLDSLIVSSERNGFNGDGCFVPRYHLSDAYTLKTYTNHQNNASSSSSSSSASTSGASQSPLNVFYGRVIPNWAMMSAPGHAVIARTMENVVEILAHEHRRDPVLRDLKFAHKWAVIMCSTGPSVLTGSAREVVLQSSRSSPVSYKLAREDWRDYGGKFKAIYIPVRHIKDHYMNKKKGSSDGGSDNSNDFLLSYLPETPLTAADLQAWQGQCIQGQNTKQIFVVDQGKRRGIPNWDTFVGLNFSMADVRVIADAKLHAIPPGEEMKSLSNR